MFLRNKCFINYLLPFCIILVGLEKCAALSRKYPKGLAPPVHGGYVHRGRSRIGSSMLGRSGGGRAGWAGEGDGITCGMHVVAGTGKCFPIMSTVMLSQHRNRQPEDIGDVRKSDDPSLSGLRIARGSP